MSSPFSSPPQVLMNSSTSSASAGSTSTTSTSTFSPSIASSSTGGGGGKLFHYSGSTGSAVPMEGSLSKWTNVMKGWQFRWFVLDENTGLLSYYTSKEKMRRGVRRGCIRLQGAVLGIDDEDDANFTITVDAKVFHLQAKNTEEREIWVRALEDAILKHARIRPGSFKPHLFQSTITGGAGLEPLVRFEQKLAQADVYLQMLIQQVNALEERPELAGVTAKGNEFVDAVKHSIVLLQIAKNTAFPATALSNPVVLRYPNPDPEIQTGIPYGSEVQESFPGSEELDSTAVKAKSPREVALEKKLPSISSPVRLSTPISPAEKTPVLFSYSSSDDEQDFYDAEDFPEESVNKKEGSRREDKLVHETDEMPGGINPTTRRPSGTREISTSSRTSVSFSDGIDYDALYDDQSDEELGSLESHGSVLSHLLSQVKIGMDLTKVVLPTFILERRSLLEMYADFFAHPDMFVAIADVKSPKERIVAVLRWYLGAFHAGRRSEVAKKPYNPILGEVFQCYWDLPKGSSTVSGTTSSDHSNSNHGSDLPDSKLLPWVENPDAVMFLAEQVSHHPPISAFYAEHLGKKISLNAHIWTKSKFLGLSIGVSNIGHAAVTLHSPTREDYLLGFPNGYARSIFTTPWVELGGSVTISSPQTGYHASVEFKTKPFFSGEKNKISAQVFSPEDKKKPFLTVEGEWNGLMMGKWSDGRTERFVDVKSLDIIQKRAKAVAQQEPNESRFMWKDVTAGLKFKDIDKATEAKFRLEERQRSEARLRAERKETWRPKMFIPAGDTWIFSEQLEQRLKQRQKAAAASQQSHQ